jgi:hypothetical protein
MCPPVRPPRSGHDRNTYTMNRTVSEDDHAEMRVYLKAFHDMVSFRVAICNGPALLIYYRICCATRDEKYYRSLHRHRLADHQSAI